MIDLRDALPEDVEPLSHVWHQSWHDAHAAHVPARLTQLRTADSFAERLSRILSATRVAGPAGKPVGFCTLQADELIHLFVARSARGTGTARGLLLDGEGRLAGRGVGRAWLTCVIGNDRAARFYEKHGWRRVGTMTNYVETSQGDFPLNEWRYEKDLRPGTGADL